MPFALWLPLGPLSDLQTAPKKGVQGPVWRVTHRFIIADPKTSNSLFLQIRSIITVELGCCHLKGPLATNSFDSLDI